MPDHVVDTNVLLVASAASPYSPFEDTHVPAAERQVVLDWILEFRGDSTRSFVLDQTLQIYQEYQNQMTSQDLGLQVLHEKMTTCLMRQVEIELDGGVACVPPDFEDFDPSDRKFLAVVLADGGQSTLVNAADSDWYEIEVECQAHDIVVEQLLDGWLHPQVNP